MSHCAPCLASTTSLLCADAIQQVAASPQMPITPNRCAFYLLKVTPNGFIRIELFASFSDLSISRNLHVLREAEPRRLRLHFKICDASARPPPLGKAPLLLLKEEEEGKNTVLRVWDSPRPRLPPPMHFCHNNSEAVVIASQNLVSRRPSGGSQSPCSECPLRLRAFAGTSRLGHLEFAFII